MERVSAGGFANCALCRWLRPNVVFLVLATYVAPEILKNIPYDESSDMWSVGVILYVLLVGCPPFADNNKTILFQKIRTGEYSFNEAEWEDISEDAIELIQNLLKVDPLQRYTAKQALQSKWLEKDDKTLESKDLSKSRDVIRRSKRKFVNVAKTIISMKSSALHAVKAKEKNFGSQEFDEAQPVKKPAI